MAQDGERTRSRARSVLRVLRPQLAIRRRTPAGTAPGTLVADPTAQPTELYVIAYGPDGLVEQPLEQIDEVGDFFGRWPVTWLNVGGLGDLGTIEAIGRIFGLHRLALEDVVNVHQRAKVEEYAEHVFIVARMTTLHSDGVQIEQLSTFVGENFVLTFQEHPADCLDPVRQRLRASRGRLREGGADYLGYAILDAVVDHYFPVLEAYSDRLEVLEDEVVTEPERETVTAIHEVKRELLALRRAVWPLRDAVNTLLRDPVPLVGAETRVYLRDVYDHTVQVIDLVENYREIASGLLDVYLSSVSNRMNEIMKVLTIIATIFIPLTFIAGVYGMNFDPAASPWSMPELSWYWGYPATLGVMALVAIGLLIYFRRKGWL